MKSAKVQGFVLNDKGLWKTIMSNPEPQLISPLGETEEKLDREFYKPLGKKLILEIENTGYQFFHLNALQDTIQERSPSASLVAKGKVLM